METNKDQQISYAAVIRRLIGVASEALEISEETLEEIATLKNMTDSAQLGEYDDLIEDDLEFLEASVKELGTFLERFIDSLNESGLSPDNRGKHMRALEEIRDYIKYDFNDVISENMSDYLSTAYDDAVNEAIEEMFGEEISLNDFPDIVLSAFAHFRKSLDASAEKIQQHINKLNDATHFATSGFYEVLLEDAA